MLLELARRTLEEAFGARDQPPDVAALLHRSPALVVPSAVFVTLWQRETGDLRGCRGETTPSRALAEAVAAMACAAAFDDPRFAPLTRDELPHTWIEISVLSQLLPIRPDAVEVGRHGLLIADGWHRGILLPQVAEEHRLDREAFLCALCQKAGLAQNAWRRAEAELFAFETETWSEADVA